MTMPAMAPLPRLLPPLSTLDTRSLDRRIVRREHMLHMLHNDVCTDWQAVGKAAAASVPQPCQHANLISTLVTAHTALAASNNV
jgi:hypothetical protein